MNRVLGFIALCGALALPAAKGMSQEFYVYPGEGQSQEQLEKDKYECYGWAKKQSGYDPMAAPTASTPPPEQKASTARPARGALGGAVGGAIVGGIADDEPGKGAAIGAVGGGLVGGMRRRGQVQKQQRARQQWEQQEASRYQQSRNSYNRAYSACLEGRGYTVK